MGRDVTDESFLKDVSKHEMKILRDDGVHRHLRFKRPESGTMHFDIVTYPHYLVYSGDMGCYVFSRIDDMFAFFRDKGEGELRINEGYWSEKLEAFDRPDGFEKFAPELLKEHAIEWLNNIDEEETDDIAALKQQLLDRLEDEVFSHMNDHEFAARDALRSFEHNGRRPFEDSWELSFREYTFRFQWCCRAIVWAIRQYDAAKRSAAQEA